MWHQDRTFQAKAWGKGSKEANTFRSTFALHKLFHNIIQLYGCVPFFDEHVAWAFNNLSSWEET